MALIRTNSKSPEETIEIGYRIGKILKPGMVVALEGKLGAGKTTLVKGIARALDINEEITSPSYIIISEYLGTYPLFHIDLYRINHSQELEDLGLEEIISSLDLNGISVIEWSERAESMMPEDRIQVAIMIDADGNRIIDISGLEGTA